MVRCSITDMIKSLFLQIGSGAHPASYLMVTRKPRNKADYSSPSGVEVKNSGKLYFDSLRLHEVQRDSLPSVFYSTLKRYFLSPPLMLLVSPCLISHALKLLCAFRVTGQSFACLILFPHSCCTSHLLQLWWQQCSTWMIQVIELITSFIPSFRFFGSFNPECPLVPFVLSPRLSD